MLQGNVGVLLEFTNFVLKIIVKNCFTFMHSGIS